jgi:hypothetical protein
MGKRAGAMRNAAAFMRVCHLRLLEFLPHARPELDPGIVTLR